jgi:hypothetical protein
LAHTRQEVKLYHEQNRRNIADLSEERWQELLVVWRNNRLEIYEDYVCLTSFRRDLAMLTLHLLVFTGQRDCLGTKTFSTRHSFNTSNNKVQHIFAHGPFILHYMSTNTFHIAFTKISQVLTCRFWH